jgi:hypothetical protein
MTKEAEAAAADVERILKAARASFFDAIDILACIEALEAGNRPDVFRSLKAANGGRAADLIQRALFGSRPVEWGRRQS